MKKYYFLSYAWKRTHAKIWEYFNEVIEEHPIAFIKECRKPLPKEDYNIIFYKRISKKVFEKYEGEL